MRYQKSLEIALRVAETLRPVKAWQNSMRLLTETLGVSMPTISRIIAGFREQGHEFLAQRTSTGWSYQLTQIKVPRAKNDGDEAGSHAGKKASRYDH